MDSIDKPPHFYVGSLFFSKILSYIIPQIEGEKGLKINFTMSFFLEVKEKRGFTPLC